MASKTKVNVKAKTAAINAAKAAAKKANTPAKSTSAAKASSTAAKKTSTALTYKPPAYDEAKYSKGINTSYYTNAINSYTQQANADRQTQLGEAEKTNQANLKQAYINRMQSDRNLQANLAAQGIRGGATESSNLRLANQYGQAVAAANTDYANSVANINRTVDQNIRDYTSDMQSRAEEYRQNQMNARWQAAREDYSNKFNAQREDAANKYERQAAETQRQTEYWSNYYINKYSGYKKKDLKKAEKEIKANLKKAKTANEKIRWQQALAGIGARRGVIATSK